jgi:hypothetical protein
MGGLLVLGSGAGAGLVVETGRAVLGIGSGRGRAVAGCNMVSSSVPGDVPGGRRFVVGSVCSDCLHSLVVLGLGG